MQPRIITTTAAVMLALGAAVAWAQGHDSAGHPTLNGHAVFGAWNPNAGGSMTGGYTVEDRPNLAGWDYRINLPYVRLNRMRSGASSGAAMVGVIEDTVYKTETLQNAHHVNNSIWVFAVDSAGVLRFKQLPSRRSPTSPAVTNVISLGSGWFQVGPSNSPPFRLEKPAAAVIREGLGTATIYVVARASDGRVLMTSRVVDAESITTWTTPWVEVAPSAASRAAIAAAFGDRLAIAWPAGGGRIDARVYTPALGTFGPVVTAATGGGSPTLVWDGTVLNLIYIGPVLQQNVWHSYATSAASFAFSAPQRVSDTVLNAACDAIAFNRRLHVACHLLESSRFRVWYTTSTTPFGAPSLWAPESFVGLDDHNSPQIGSVGDELYIVATSGLGNLEYARRDPHVMPYEFTGGSSATDRWLEVGSAVDSLQDEQQLGLWEAELLSFNHDLYLTAANPGTDASAGLYVVNFSRAALKSLMWNRLGIRFTWGTDEGTTLFASGADPIAMSGGEFLAADVNGDGRSDLVHAFRSSAGGALRVALSSGSALMSSTQWLSNWARPNDLVRSGDVNGDGRDDLVRCFVNTSGEWEVNIAFSSGGGISSQITWRAGLPAGNSTCLIGDVSGDGKADLVIVRFGSSPAPVDVALASATSFGVPSPWLSAMAVTGDLPFLADVDADGRKDLVVASRTAFGGAPTPVWVARSTGGAFTTRAQWSAAFMSFCTSADVGDFNQDGREDLLCFVRERAGASIDPRTVYVAFARGASFGSLTTLVSSFFGARDLPLIGNLDGDTKGAITGVAADSNKPMLDLFRINLDSGAVSYAPSLTSFPVPSGVPWERYRFFTEKGLGTAMFPEWLWKSPGPCVLPDHNYLLLGASGSGSRRTTRLSVRPGSAQGHVLEEFGHSVFFNCFHPGPDDRFGLADDIFIKPTSVGGFEANNLSDSCTGTGSPLPGVPTWIDCRDPEHYFLAFMIEYRTRGDRIRASIAAETNAMRRMRYQAQYDWLTKNWFKGVAYYADPTPIDARRETVGLQCLPHFDNCPTATTRLTVEKILVHPDHNHFRLFDLQIDGVTVRANVNAGSTGPQMVSPGNHTVGEIIHEGAFFTVIGGDCAEDGTVSLAMGESKICTITNFDNTGGCPSQSICCEPGHGTLGCLQCSAAGKGCP